MSYHYNLTDEDGIRYKRSTSYFTLFPLPRRPFSIGDLVELASLPKPNTLEWYGNTPTGLEVGFIGEVNDVFWHEKSLTWWVKVIGLDYNIPQRHFKLVFTR